MTDTHLDWRTLTVEPTGAKEHECGCCGAVSRTVWGFVHGAAGIFNATHTGHLGMWSGAVERVTRLDPWGR